MRFKDLVGIVVAVLLGYVFGVVLIGLLPAVYALGVVSGFTIVLVASECFFGWRRGKAYKESFRNKDY